MIISTKKGTPKEELEKIVDKFEKQGLDVTLITGKDYNVFGLVGDTTKIDERDVLANPWIDNVTRVSAPYKRANRLFHPADSVIDCGGVKIGSKEKIAVMAGPCSIEGEEQALRIADHFARNPKDNPLLVTILALFNQFREIFRINYLRWLSRHKGVPFPSDTELIGILRMNNAYALGELKQTSARWDNRRVFRILGLLREYDAKSKGMNAGGAPDGELLRELLLKIFLQ